VRRLVSVVFLAGLAASSWFFVARMRDPVLPDIRDPLGLFPPIPGEKRSIAELKAALESADPNTRREALRSFGRLADHGKLPSSGVVPLLLEGVKDEDAGVRAVGAAYLRKRPADPATVVPVFVSLLKDGDALVRYNAVLGLNAHWKVARPAIPALVDTWNDPDVNVRRMVSAALLYFPEVRYRLPEEWRRLAPEEARDLLRRMGLTPSGEQLHAAVRHGDLAGVFLLLRAGVDANTRAPSPAGQTPLCLVSAFTRPEITRFLLDGGADPRFKDNFGRRPWDWAAGSFSDEGVRYQPFGKESLELLREAGAAPSPADQGSREAQAP
jgi:hypothetical protein